MGRAGDGRGGAEVGSGGEGEHAAVGRRQRRRRGIRGRVVVWGWPRRRGWLRPRDGSGAGRGGGAACGGRRRGGVVVAPRRRWGRRPLASPRVLHGRYRMYVAVLLTVVLGVGPWVPQARGVLLETENQAITNPRGDTGTRRARERRVAAPASGSAFRLGHHHTAYSVVVFTTPPGQADDQRWPPPTEQRLPAGRGLRRPPTEAAATGGRAPLA